MVIAVDKSIGGAHYTGDKGSNIVLNDKAMKNAQDYMKTLAHELTHGLESQGIIGDKGKTSLDTISASNNFEEARKDLVGISSEE